MIIVSVNKKPSTGEWLASVNIDGKFAEGPTAYTEDPEEAVNAAISTVEQYRKIGKQAELSSAQGTVKQVTKYRPDWLVSEARRIESCDRPLGSSKDWPNLQPGEKPYQVPGRLS